MKMKQYYTAERLSLHAEECAMIAGPMTYTEAYASVRNNPDYPRYVFIVSRLIEVED